MYACRTDEPVARAARTGPEVARALREVPEVDSVSPAAAPADGAASLAQFQAENSDCTSARLGVQKLGLRRALPVPSSRHGKGERRESPLQYLQFCTRIYGRPSLVPQILLL